MTSSSNPTPGMDAYRKLLFETVLVKRTRLYVKNKEVRVWGLVAKCDIPSGTFIGFYTGAYDRTICPSSDSIYALDMGRGQPCILPFADENRITPHERNMHPLACMNEPSDQEHANCHMVVQDFARSEVEFSQFSNYHQTAWFFRGVACFACDDIAHGDPLTWHYGNEYQSHRDNIGYVVGKTCRAIEDEDLFVKERSRAVFKRLEHVPSYCVYPVSRKATSLRFNKRRHRVNSDDEMSSSGSETYNPISSRRVRRRH